MRIPVQVFEEFSETAGREFGFTHGAKKQLFLKMWQNYKAHCMQAQRMFLRAYVWPRDREAVRFATYDQGQGCSDLRSRSG